MASRTLDDGQTVKHRFSENVASPSTPASGYGYLYFKNDGKAYSLNDSGTEVALGGSLGVAQTAPTELTIASGAITVTQGFHKIDTEADAATDNLDTINGLVTNALYLFRAENVARTVVFRHATGNIRTSSLSNVALNDITNGIIGWYDGTTFNVLAVASLPNDVDAWGAFPDSDLKFGAQDTTGEMYHVTGDEMRRTYFLPFTSGTGSYSWPSQAMADATFDDTTDRTWTVTDVAIGHMIMASALQVSGGTGHKILLPVGCTWDGTNRAVLLAATTDRFIATAYSTTRWTFKSLNGCSFAAS